MVFGKIYGAFSKFNDVLGVTRFFTDPLKREAEDLNRCLAEVGKKRANALRRKNQRDAQGRPTLINWEEDDRYADDKFYQKKLQECYDQYTRLNKTFQRAR